MKKLQLGIVTLALVLAPLFFNSCSGCVKGGAKKATELSLDAFEGVLEAVDEKGDKLAEKGASALGSIAEGLGRSLEKGLDKHAKDVAKAAGKIVVQSADGALEGLEEGISLVQYYDTLQCKTNLPKDVRLDLVGKQRLNDIVDTYLEIEKAGDYDFSFEAYDKDNTVIISRQQTITKSAEDKRPLTMVSFSLDAQDRSAYRNVKSVLIKISKK